MCNAYYLDVFPFFYCFLEWLAKFHGLSYIAMQRYGDEVQNEGLNAINTWLEVHPWIRHARSGGKEETQHSSLNNEILESKGTY